MIIFFIRKNYSIFWHKKCMSYIKSKTGKCILKTTEKHLNPNTVKKMSVKLETQLLSNSKSCIEVAIRSGELHSITAENTAYFVKRWTIYLLHITAPNWKILIFKIGLSVTKNSQVLQAINARYELIENWYKVDKKDA